MYETKISDARWIAYDIPGNIGWIAYIVTVIIALTNDPDVLSCCSIIPAVLMLMGVAELISERIARLDRILPKARLYRGFGALTAGGALGMILSVIMVIKDDSLNHVIMLLGAVLCLIFGGLLLIGYKKQ
ncbi:MAG: hypothetical protein IJ639_07135 [Ruminococcus sp.]|nr:hypothetical protein [Ruminococcus sp.]